MQYRTLDVPVAGGNLRVGRWGSGPAVIVAAHGLTANHLCFQALAEQLGEGVTLLAPDLRGRGRSSAVGGPYGMAVHADDLVAVLDHAGASSATVVGHSMGAFVAVVAADRHPERVRGLVLVDGGLPLDLAHLASLPIEEVVRAVVGPALDRLRMTFPDLQHYLDYWRPHPALVEDWNEHVEALYAYDLVGEAPELRSSVVEKAVLEDSASELRSGDVQRALERLAQPVVLVRAPRGILDQEPPLYPNSAVEAVRSQVPHLSDVLVPGVNHYTIVLTDRGAKAVACVVRQYV
ncbi:MAG: alpha/beta hydrolase [Acidimicrobiales bacterium]